MNQFEWLESYSLGENALDEQHKSLFELSNSLLKTTNHAQLVQNVMQLYKHMREHFRAEEDFMMGLNYPGYDKHVAAHNALLTKVVSASDSIHKNEWPKEEISELMSQWVRHITVDDLALKDLHGEKVSAVDVAQVNSNKPG